MFIGHYAAGLIGKSVDRRIPLWHLFVAAQLVDIMWVVLALAGVEKVRIVEGFTEANPLDLYYYPFSHGLIGALALAMAATAAYRLVGRWRGWQGSSVVVGAVVFSHWLADLVVHAPDLPLIGDDHKVGLGLWNHLAASLAVEIALMVGAVALYMRATERKTPAGSYAMPAYAAVMIAMLFGATFGPAPPSPTALAGMGLAYFSVFAAVAAWLDPKRA